MEKYCHCYNSPLGDLLIIANNEAVVQLYLPGSWSTQQTDGCREDKNVFVEVEAQLDEYFQGKRKEFTLTLQPRGTEYQQRVWQQLSKIPYGTTTSYSGIAAKIGSAKGARAVGLANNRNPIPIIIPCHRVIGKNGSLTGYGGGLEAKQQLLDLEKRYTL